MPLSPRVLKPFSETKIGIRTKLLLSFSVQLGLAFLILLSSILILDSRRTKSDLLAVQDRLRSQILLDGTRLVMNASTSLKPLVASGAYTAIEEIAANNVRNDSDIVYVIYMDK